MNSAGRVTIGIPLDRASWLVRQPVRGTHVKTQVMEEGKHALNKKEGIIPP
jgi:hypothetical protein